MSYFNLINCVLATLLFCYHTVMNNHLIIYTWNLPHIKIIVSNSTVIIGIFTVKMPIIMLIYNISQFHMPHEDTDVLRFPMIYHTVVYTHEYFQ